MVYWCVYYQWCIAKNIGGYKSFLRGRIRVVNSAVLTTNNALGQQFLTALALPQKNIYFIFLINLVP